MRVQLVVVLASGLLLGGCGQYADRPTIDPVSPTSVVGASSAAAQSTAEVPFHSELTWTKTEGSQVSLCTHALPEGRVYLMRNTIRGTAVSTHLGAGEFEGHTCVYGTPGKPAGWFADYRWTAANGDVLVSTSAFLYWTGQPGASVAVDKVTFENGGTGRFEFAEGEGMAYVNAPQRTATFDGLLRYGNKEK